jgi:mono/diheme cytochrome c family protein
MKTILAFTLGIATASLSATAIAQDRAATASQVKRGQFLVQVGGCSDCHAPWKMGPNGPEPDLSRGLTGHPEGLAMPPAPKLAGPWLWVGGATNTAYAGPWGVSYASNLTPDNDTGIGRWREEDFIKALRTGKHAGVGRPIMPPMPWTAYRHYPDADLKAMFAYLRAQPPVRNKVPDYQPPPK